MNGTYCGKSCVGCEHIVSGSCPGCQFGPGSRAGDCQIVACCQEKRRESCLSCGQQGSCYKFQDRNNIPMRRAAARQVARDRDDLLRRRVPVLATWLWVMFWFIIPSSLVSLFADGTTALGKFLPLVCSLGYSLVLLRLSRESDCYRKAGLWGIAAVVLSVLTPIDGETSWTSIFSLPAGIAGFFCTYQEYMGHANVAGLIRPDLARRWRKLWPWNLGFQIATICIAAVTIYLALIAVTTVAESAPIHVLISGLLMVVSALGNFVVGVIELVFLYQTAQAFRKHPMNE